MINKTHKQKIWLATIVSVFMCTMGVSSSAWANDPGSGNAGTGSIPSGGGCAKSNPTAIAQNWDYEDDCFGATWRYYKAESDDIYIAGNGNVKSGRVTGCASSGGYYYRLAYERYSAGLVYSNFQTASLGYQVGLLPVYYIDPPMGTTYGGASFVYGITKNNKSTLDGHQSIGGARTWEFVKKEFEDAKKYAKEHPGFGGNLANMEWKNVSWFCWREGGMDPEETHFSSYSIIDSEETGRVSTGNLGEDKSITKEIKTDKDKVRVTFSHRLWYHDGNKLSGNFGDAETDWEVMVTRDGKGYYGKDLVEMGTDFEGQLTTSGKNNNAIDYLYEIGIQTYDIDVSNLKTGEKTTVCSKISYKPKKIVWEYKNNSYVMDKSKSSGQASSTGCVTIIKSNEDESDLEFWSNSSAEATVNGNTVTSGTSENDGTLNLQVNLDANDESEVKVKFWHNLHYTGEIPGNLKDDICTKFDFTSQPASIGNPPTIIDDNLSIAGNQYCASRHDPRSKNDSTATLGNIDEAVGKGSETVVKVAEGDSQKVCQTIKYDPKNFLILNDKKTNEVITDGGSGSGSSTACVTITRGKEPQPPEADLPDEDPFYTGEPDDLIFEDIEVQSNYSKVLLEAVSYYYRVPVNIDMSSNPAEGTDETDLSPDAWFKNKSDAQDFTRVESVSDERSYYLPNDHSPSVSPSDVNTLTLKGKKVDIVVPDTVGDKICKGVAYHWQERSVKTERHVHSVTCTRYGCYNNYDNIYSYPDPDTLKTYWQIEGSTCEPILKKPSVNIWNGSLSTQSGVKTTLSNRYSYRGDPTYTINKITENIGDERNKFGSWSEYLAVVRGTVSDKPFGFGSGTSLSYKGSKPNNELLANSPLTIANNSSPIGNAQVNTSSTYLSRLGTYIYNNEAFKNNSDPKVEIHECGSSCEIDGDIINDQNATSVKDLKQIIYHATGNINIHSNVSRIDAWLISDDGIVNTCAEYNNGESTQAKVQGYAPSENANCSKQLTVNGPIIAKGIKLNRTAGSDPKTYTDVSLLGNNTDPRAIPGEVFNLSADTYLWAYAQASRYGSSYTEAYSRELPPRY